MDFVMKQALGGEWSDVNVLAHHATLPGSVTVGTGRAGCGTGFSLLGSIKIGLWSIGGRSCGLMGQDLDALRANPTLPLAPPTRPPISRLLRRPCGPTRP